jgi:hypothetical protein
MSSSVIFRILAVCLVYFSMAQAENQFDVPPVPGPVKDYSDNPTYNIGETVQLMWHMNFTGATLTLWQDNKTGDAQGGDHVIILCASVLCANYRGNDY